MRQELRDIFKVFQDEINEELLIKNTLNDIEQEFNNCISQIRSEYASLSSTKPVNLTSQGFYPLSRINDLSFEEEQSQANEIYNDEININNLNLLSKIYHNYTEKLNKIKGNSIFKERIERHITEEIFYLLCFNRYFKVIAYYFGKGFNNDNKKITIPLVSEEDGNKLGLIITPAEISQLLCLEKINFNDYLISMLKFIDVIVDYTTEIVILLSIDTDISKKVKSQYSLSLINAQIITKLQNGFQMLDLKNDNIRRKFDGLKYNLKKVNSIVYDLSLRNLIQIEVDVI